MTVLLSVRGDVQRLLEQDLRAKQIENEKSGLIQYTPNNGDAEDILFCEAPAGFRGLNSLLLALLSICFIFAPLAFGLALAMFVSPFIYLPCLAVWELLNFVLWLFVYRYHIFGYQVITSHRVVQVILERKFYIVRPGVRSIYLASTIKFLLHDKLLVAQVENDEPIKSTHAVRITIASNKTGGQVDVKGNMDVINLHVKDFALVENILTSQIEKLTTACQTTLPFQLKSYEDKMSDMLDYYRSLVFLFPCIIYVWVLFTNISTLCILFQFSPFEAHELEHVFAFVK